MIRLSVSALSEQLRAYCTTINSDCELMKSKLQHAPAKSGCKSELTYLSNIASGLAELEARAEALESAVAGRKESRLNEITLEELLYCAATLYEANEDGIRRVKAARNPSAVDTPVSAPKGKAAAQIDKENVVNDVTDEDMNGCVVDLSYQSEMRNSSYYIMEEDEANNDLEGSRFDEAAKEGFCSPEGKNAADEEDPKTPSLEAWKLSHATRHILDQQRYISKGSSRISPDNIILHKGDNLSKMRTIKNYSNAQVVTRAHADTPPSPGRLDVSSSYTFYRRKEGDTVTDLISFEANTPIEQTSPGCILGDDAPSDPSMHLHAVTPSAGRHPQTCDILSTPIDDAKEILRVHGRHTSATYLEYSVMSNSPATPTFGGTPMTCQVLEPTGEIKNISIYSQKGEANFVNDSIVESHSEGIINKSAMSSDDEIDPVAFASPPKAVKVLNPRRGETAIAADSENGWIPLVTNEEWTSAPSFLKMQIGLSDLNTTLSLLNRFIAENLSKAENTFSKRLETFSFDEIIRIVGNKIDPIPVKVVVLGLVHFKKLDVGTENSVKVYKIKRFY